MEKDATVVYSATQNTRQPHEVDLIGIELQDHVRLMLTLLILKFH